MIGGLASARGKTKKGRDKRTKRVKEIVEGKEEKK